MSVLASIHLHPLKSCAPLPVATAEVRPRGLRHDRRWLAVDAAGRFLTGRQHPQLTLIRATPTGDGLQLSAPGMAMLQVPLPLASAQRRDVEIWKSTVDAVDCGDAAADWLGSFLGQVARLVRMDVSAHRLIGDERASADAPVSFADTAPLLLISQAALDALNARMAAPVTMARFRPNLVVEGVGAHAEDGWRRVRIGAVEFEALKPCVRCVFTTVDPVTATADPRGEPLRTLATYRRSSGGGVKSGQLLLPCGPGELRVGDPVVPLA
jgi:uncharacterized protein